MGSSATFGIDQNHNLAVEPPKGNPPLFTVPLPNVLARDREVVPNGLAPDEIQAVLADIGAALWLVPRDHELIVVTK